MNIDSDKIFIYPVGERTRENIEGVTDYGKLGKVNIEQNIITQNNNISDKNSYSLFNSKDVNEINIKNNTLIINQGAYIINGYCFRITNAIQVNLSTYSLTSTYYIYFSIELETKYFNEIPVLELKGTDELGLYTGVSINISSELPEETSNKHILLLGTIRYTTENSWSFRPDNNLRTKIKINTMKIQTSDVSINPKVNETIVEDWLKSFIVDDGEI